MSKLERNKRTVEHEDEHGGKRRRDDKITSEVLLNPDILEILFKHLDPTRLKLNRTVCKTWNEVICLGLRKRGSVSYVQAQGDCSDLMEVLSRNQELELPQTLQNMVLQIENKRMLDEILSVPLELPINKLCINEGMDFRSPRSTRWMYALLRRCSSTLAFLKIPLCNVEIPESAKTSWELKLPLLEELVLTVDSRNLMDDINPRDPHTTVGTKRSAGALYFFSNLINSAPKLSSLEILHKSGSIGNFLRSFKLTKLRKLKIWSGVYDHGSVISSALSWISFENLTSLSLNSLRGGFNNSNVLQLLQRNSNSLESLSLSLFSFELPPCPNLKNLSIRNFEWRHHLNLYRFPALHSIELCEVDSSFIFNCQTCPASLKRVKIGWGQPLSEVRKALLNLYRFFARSATTWELPYEYLASFCDYITTEKGGKGVKSLTIDFNPFELSYTLLRLRKGLEDVSKFKDLEELTLKNSRENLPSETWHSFKPQLLPNLHTLTYFSHSMDFEEVPKEVSSKLRLIRKVLLLRHEPAHFDRQAEDFFSKFPNATQHVTREDDS